MSKLVKAAALLAALCVISGCAVYSVADATVSVAATAVETTVDVTAGAVDLVVPDAD